MLPSDLKNKPQGVPEILSNYLLQKPDMRRLRDSFKLRQKPDKLSLRHFFKLFQNPNTKGPRDSLKLLQK